MGSNIQPIINRQLEKEDLKKFEKLINNKLHMGTEEYVEPKKRSFGGNFAAIIAGKNTKEGQHEKKHLKAYLKGRVGFGRTLATGIKQFKTQVIYK